MHKPSGMSRQDARNLKAIVREQLSNPFVSVDFTEYSATGLVSSHHDEGFSCSFVEVSLSDEPGKYSVRYETWGRDCDGPHSTQDEFTVGPAGKRKRYYMSRDWKRNRPEGKFGTKSAFKILK